MIDLDWHRRTYQESKFQWTGLDAVLVATEWTRGQDTFTNVHDLTALHARQRELAEYTTTCERAMGEAIDAARSGLKVPVSKVADLLGLTNLDAEHAVYLSALDAIWSSPGDRSGRSNAQVRRIQRMCSGFLFGSPLLLAWELKQLWRLYQSAGALLEDTLIDLVIELEAVDPIVIAHALDLPNRRALEHRINAQRTERGEIGDPRRSPRQYA